MKIDIETLPETLEQQAQMFCDLAGDRRTAKLLVMAAQEIRHLRTDRKELRAQLQIWGPEACHGRPYA